MTSMTSEEALYLLGLSTPADTARLRSAYDSKRAELTERLANAPTDGLRAKYQAALGELVQAYELLNASHAPRSSGGLSHTQMRDLPGAAPSFTQFGASAAGTEELSAGTVLAERYEIVRLLGRGGMGAVYQAFDRLKQEDVAVKVLLPHLLSNEKARERFFGEAKIACRLAHPHIVKVFDVSMSGPYAFMTMELLEGQTLRERMEAQKDSYQPFPVDWVVGYACQLIDALSYAHQWIVHRDLKPENIWIDYQAQLKLMDFGIARAFSNTQLTKTGMALGTAYYMAPEQLAGSKDVGGHADQYALGVILYELLTGQIPQGAVQTPKQARSEIPSALSAAVMKAMAPKPADRHQTLEEFGRALERRSLISLQTLSPALSSKRAGIVAAAGLAFGALIASGAPGSLWEAVRPVSKAELQNQQAAALRFQAQIAEGLKHIADTRQLLQRRNEDLASSKSRLEAQVATAREAAARETYRQQLQAALAEQEVLARITRDSASAVFESTLLARARSELAVAEAFIRERAHLAAIELLKPLAPEVGAMSAYLTDIDEFWRDRVRYQENKDNFLVYIRQNPHLSSELPARLVDDERVLARVSIAGYREAIDTTMPRASAAFADLLERTRNAENERIAAAQTAAATERRRRDAIAAVEAQARADAEEAARRTRVAQAEAAATAATLLNQGTMAGTWYFEERRRDNPSPKCTMIQFTDNQLRFTKIGPDTAVATITLSNGVEGHGCMGRKPHQTGYTVGLRMEPNNSALWRVQLPSSNKNLSGAHFFYFDGARMRAWNAFQKPLKNSFGQDILYDRR